MFLLTSLACLAFIGTPSIMKGQTREDIHAKWIASNVYSGDQLVSSFDIAVGETQLVSVTLAKAHGSNPPKYYQSSSGIRLYAGNNGNTGNTLSIAPVGTNAIKEIKYTYYKQGSKYYADVTCDPATGFEPGIVPTDQNTPSYDYWRLGEGWKNAVTITLGTQGQRVLRQLDVTVAVGSAGQTYTVTYVSNNEMGESYVDPNLYVHGQMVTVLPNHFTYPDHTFDKWGLAGTTSYYYPGQTFSISGDMEFFAQWINIANGIYDVLNPENVNAGMQEPNIGTYSDWTVTCTTGEISSTYIGKSCYNTGAIQITNSTSGNSKYSGIVTTETYGLVDKVQVVWDANTSNGRTLQVFGRQTPYASTEDLYTINQGTLLGTIVYGTDTELDIDIMQDQYPYIGLRSLNGAMYLDEIRILWDNVEVPSVIEFSPVAIDLGDVVLGQTVDTNFVVSQSYLGDNISLSTVSGTLNPTSIPRNANPTTVTWSYTPTSNDVGSQTVNVIASSTWTPDGETEPVTVTKILPITMTVLDPNAGQALHTAKNSFVEVLNANPNATRSVAISLAGVQTVANSQVQVIGQHGQYLYLQDGERGLLVYGSGAPLFETGAKFYSGTLIGTLVSYHGIVELTDFSFLNYETNTEELFPVTVEDITTINGDINHEYEHRYVKLKGLTISVDNGNNWTVANSGNSMPLYDRLSVGYASKTLPNSDDTFTVNGVYDPYYSSNATHCQLVPTALSDILSDTPLTAPVFVPEGGQSLEAAVETTYVTLTPDIEHNATMVYSIDRTDRFESDSEVTINLTDGTTYITAYCVRDFYPDSEVKGFYYVLPSNVRSVTFMVNGVNAGTAHVVQNPHSHWYLNASQCPSVNDLGLFSFRGWSSSPNPSDLIEDIELFEVPGNGATLYAVFGEALSYYYKKITNASQISAGEYVIVGYDGMLYYPLKNAASSGSPTAVTFGSLGLELSGDGTELSGDNLPLVTWTFTGTPSEMTVTSTADANLHLYLQGNSSTGVRVGTTSQTWTVDEDNVQVETFNMKNNNNNRYLTLYNSLDWRAYEATSTSSRLILFKKMPANSPNDLLYTRVFINEDGTGVTAEDEIAIAGPSVIPSGSFLNMNGYLLISSNAANFLIQNGAVFTPMSGNENINATVKKSVVGYGTDINVQNGWQLLGSPVGQVNANGMQQTGGNLVAGFYDAGETNYDLYRFDPTEDLEWRNHKANGYSTVFGQWDGILYASQVDRTLTFTGTLVTSCANQTFSYTGWNLIANPFTCPAYLGGSVGDYARMVENSGVSELQLAASGSPVAPMEGIFVETTETSQTFSFTTAQNVGQNGQGMVNIEVVSNSASLTQKDDVIDNARIRFGEGSMLGKLMLNENGTKLYIPQGGKDYAVVRAQAEGELPINFKSAQNGSFTLRVNVEGAEMNYLHLIDNMNGADIDLLAEPSYTFEARITDYASRFRLVFSAKNEDGASTDSATFAYYNGSEWVVNCSGPSTGSGTATLQVVDMMGRVLRSEVVSGNATIGLNQKPGVYMLRLVNSDSVKVQKVVVR